VGVRTPKYTLAGCGPGSLRFLTVEVLELAAEAKVLAGASRLLELFPASPARRLPFEGPIDAWLERLASLEEDSVVVLVSGDPGCFSLASRITARFGIGACRVIPGISSVQVACAALGLTWENAAVVSAHSGLPRTWPDETRDPWVVLMGASGAEATVAAVAEHHERHCTVCDDLTLDTERIVRVLPQTLASLSPHPRRIVVLTRKSNHES
jgi:precorrin-6y C5,15-methyltransferase (decarboxylating) CbiE subunit